ncbi:MAG: DinB family protein [Acidobacteriota bacterium]|nr:DinB family protein [Acidobacteriota bacterium]
MQATLASLAAFPAVVRRIVEAADPSLRTKRPSTGLFALVEQAWHLADLEVEGYGVRIKRILTEDNPSLPDFRGDVVARERNYLALDVNAGLTRFADARARNLARLAQLTAAQWQRAGVQEGVGVVTLERLALMMREHDASHEEELGEVGGELGVALVSRE